MNPLKYFLCIICFCAVICEPGCIVIRGEHCVLDEIEIDISPPPPSDVVVVARPARPSGVHVWIDGHYIVHLGAWKWVEGHWAKPQRRGAVWVPPHVRRKGDCWCWRPGHWH
jgi:hypothetical protein